MKVSAALPLLSFMFSGFCSSAVMVDASPDMLNDRTKNFEFERLGYQAGHESLRLAHYQQTYRGYPVMANGGVIATESYGEVLSSRGTVVSGISADLEGRHPTLKSGEAIEIAMLDYMRNDPRDLMFERRFSGVPESNPELYVFVDGKLKAYWVYSVSWAEESGVQVNYVVDAQSGDVIQSQVTDISSRGDGRALESSVGIESRSGFDVMPLVDDNTLENAFWAGPYPDYWACSDARSLMVQYPQSKYYDLSSDGCGYYFIDGEYVGYTFPYWYSN